MAISKTFAQRRHAKRRAFERYDINLNRHEYRQLVADIQKGRATFLRKQSNRVSVFLVTVKGQQARVIYDRHRKTIVTFLPPVTPGEDP